MAITPDGSPAWARNVAHTTYGGSVDKTNYQSQGVTNARTDVGAEAFVRLTEDAAAAVRTADFCVVTFTPDDGTPDDPTVHHVEQMNGVRSTDYDGGNAPAGFPAVERVSDGVYDVTFTATPSDDYSQSYALTIEHAEAVAHGSTAAIVTVDITAANVVRVRVFDAAGSALADTKVTLSVS